LQHNLEKLSASSSQFNAEVNLETVNEKAARETDNANVSNG
jgi:hypothetical protein